MKKNILDEFWVNWNEMGLKERSETLKRVSNRLKEEVPTQSDLSNFQSKLREYQDEINALREERSKTLISFSKKNDEKHQLEFVNYDPWNPMKNEKPSAEIKACELQYYNGEIDIEELANKLKRVPRGEYPVILDDLWNDWTKKSIEEQVHLFFIALNRTEKGELSAIDAINKSAHRSYLESKLNVDLTILYW